MSFSLREVQAKDLRWCASVLEDGFESRPALRANLPAIWASLLVSDEMTIIVIADDFTSELVAFGASAIVSDECLKYALNEQEPNFAAHVFEHDAYVNDSSKRWIMGLKQIRRVNHPDKGVNLAILHYSEVLPNRQQAEFRLVRNKALNQLVETQRGYAMKELIMEIYGSADLPYVSAMGLKVRTSYPEWRTDNHLKQPERYSPYLVGLTREEAVNNWGSPAELLFGYSPPVFFFTILQQRVLLRACRHQKDDAIALDLGVEISTIREHWRAIFSCVEAVQKQGKIKAEVLPGFWEARTRSRDPLISYLKQHPEELRPADPRLFQRLPVPSHLKTPPRQGGTRGF